MSIVDGFIYIGYSCLLKYPPIDWHIFIKTISANKNSGVNTLPSLIPCIDLNLSVKL